MGSKLNALLSLSPIVLTGGAIGMVAAQLIGYSKLGIFFESNKNLVTRTLILFVVGCLVALLVWLLICVIQYLWNKKSKKTMWSNGTDMDAINDELESHCKQFHPEVGLEDCVYSHRGMY